MNYYLKIHIIFICFHCCSLFSQNSSNYSWKKLKNGFSFIAIDGNIDTKKKYVSEKENFAVITFKTNVPSQVRLYINETYLFTIDKFNSYAVRVNPKTFRFKAIFSDGSENTDFIYASSGTQYNVNLSHAILETNYTSKALKATIKGTRVNFRASPNTSKRDNIIDQLDENFKVEILDRKVITLNADFRITKWESNFYPQNGSSPFKINSGVSVQYIRKTNELKCLVKLQSEDDSILGEMFLKDLESLKNSQWYKINYNGKIGWVYGSFVKF